ncbi:hypothetical protein FQV26_10405 [Planococcus sp. CPCC 101016]|uniref:Cthe_2314 family HEPN domain-containing protein n=1 Tax=Planococcus sp. CPCC 101016 TaxID=2599617 RepID=UPI0011B69B1B|nr:Cthe_2314 family HEPN domain-containing protein [Planococcus sp. CPCC 101016]TWT08195.1 hypothetical protein FQV26_10405 [Planococcus sp. CPCC 101016]
MTIYIEPFEGINDFDINSYSKENPLHDYKFSENIFRPTGNDPHLILRKLDAAHWNSILTNRLLSVNLNFSYCMFYFYKGIPDEEWYISPGRGGQSVEYYPNFENKHYSNLYNFTYFADIYFLKAYTVCETIGHLLFKFYEFKIDEKNSLDQISFNSAIYRLKNIYPDFYKALNKVKYSDAFKKGVAMRNDIAHNHPPYEITSGIRFSSKGASFGIGEYTTAGEIKKVMIDFMESIKKLFEILHKYLADSKLK